MLSRKLLNKACRVSVAAALAAVIAVSSNASAATPEEVDAALAKGVSFLLSRQKPDGTWERNAGGPENAAAHGVDGNQWGGRTALCTYALLAAGVKPLDPQMVKATEFLRKADIIGFYSLGVRANVWKYLPRTEENRAAAARDARMLLAGIAKAGGNKGFYTYTGAPGSIDISCSQYGVLGAWAASQTLEAFPEPYWTLVETNWRLQQGNDGAWGYNGKPKPGADGHGGATIQMTAAGVATLFITQEFLHADDGIEGNKGNIVDPWINKGLGWISKNFDDLIAKPNNYALYGIERVGVASGYKYFGKLDWFDAGADVLIRTQNKQNGNWGDEVNTSFALLFLSRGRAPVMMNKLQYNVTAPKQQQGKEANWNQRPRDVANATRWVQETAERTLNWQIVNLNVATVRDLHDSAILYIAGNQALSFTDKEKAMLKQYVEEGGMIIGNADVAKPEFNKSFRELGQELFPEYEFGQIQDKMEHPLLVNQQFKASEWKRKPRLEALGNRARVFMLLIPNDDFSRTMQKRDANREEVFQFFANAFLYSVDKTQAKYKGQTHVVRADDKVSPSTTVKVARLKYNGRWDPEPGGWRRLAAVMHNVDKVKLDVKAVELGKEGLEGYRIAHLTGTDQFSLTPEQRSALKAFVDAGGLLVVDAAGGFGEFDSAFQGELAKVLPEQASQVAEPLRRDHPLYAQDAAQKLEPKFRVFAQQKLGPDAMRFRLRGISNKDGKLGVIYSPDDLSVGLVGNDVDGIIGYTPELSTTLMRRIITLRQAGKL
jgi:hypothetical protein